MNPAQRASRVCLLLAIGLLLASPFGLVVPAPYWLGAAVVFGGLAWAVRAFDPPVRQERVAVDATFDPSLLESLRAEKNRFFRNSPDSPLLAEQRPGFVALRYFPPNVAALHRVRVIPVETATAALSTTNGDVMEYLRVGEVRFDHEGLPCRLSVYKADAFDEQLFLPFTDATSGDTTYGGGRYLELIALGDDEYVLDFNRAYNPYCAYNAGWACPIPPAENRLGIPIEAGERTFQPISAPQAETA